jgi:outer membrane receptor protein involved in Fe transport
LVGERHGFDAVDRKLALADHVHQLDAFSEATDTNVTLLPSYSIINLSAQYEVTPRLMAQVHVANLRDSLTFTEGDPLFNDLLSPDGTRSRGVARPLFGRTIRASLTYRF